jgi:hypothetical protein
MDKFSVAGTPGRWMVDTIPFCECPRPYRRPQLICSEIPAYLAPRDGFHPDR